jgi:hypothetical protein
VDGRTGNPAKAATQAPSVQRASFPMITAMILPAMAVLPMPRDQKN